MTTTMTRMLSVSFVLRALAMTKEELIVATINRGRRHAHPSRQACGWSVSPH